MKLAALPLLEIPFESRPAGLRALWRLLILVVLLATAGWSHSAPPPSVHDEFDGVSLGSDWSILQNSSIAVIGGVAMLPSSENWLFIGYRDGAFGTDQYSEAVLAASKRDDLLVQVYARRRESDLARYAFHYNADPGVGSWEIKYDGVPTTETRILATRAGPGPKPEDTLRIEVVGTNPVRIRTFLNGALMLTAEDASPQRIQVAGRAGIVARMAKDAASNLVDLAVAESWTGGKLISGAPASPLLIDGP